MERIEALVRGERGSFPLVLLAAIIIGALVITLVATVLSGQSKVQHNRAHTEAITGAEAAVQQGFTLISTLDATDPRTTITSDELPPEAGDEIDGVSFTWTATRLGPLVWEIEGTGRSDSVRGRDVARTVTVLAERQSEFFLAAFADVGFRMLGANGAQSYTATDQDTGTGVVGSNGTIEMQGNAYADAIFLMGSGATCTGNGCNSGPITGFPSAYDIEDLRERVQDLVDANCETGDFQAYSGSNLIFEPGDYCVSTLTTPNFGQITLGDDASLNDPVRLFVTGDIEFGRQGSYNCGPGCSMVSAPDSGAFQIYSVGNLVSFGNQGEAAAAIAAPNANCVGNPSNAQFDLYGALVCNDLSNQGGWDFHFDERLLGVGEGRWAIQQYREEFTSATG